MAQVEQVQLLGANAHRPPWPPTTTSPVELRPQTHPMQIEAIINPRVCIDDSVQGTTSPMDVVSTESSATEDDDVQIIFCAPRRRKKRRRKYDKPTNPLKAFAHIHRVGSTHSASPLSQVCGPPASAVLSPKIHHVVPQEAPRRRSIGVVQRLELCRLVDENSPSSRAGSLPLIPCVVNNSVSNVEYPWFAEPSYCETLSTQFPSLMDSTASWWDQSLPTLQPRPLPSIPWRPLQIEDPSSKKRKLDEAFSEASAPPGHLRQSVQVSPRTTPASAATSPLFVPFQITSNQFDFHGSGHNLPASASWPNLGWNALEYVDRDHRGLTSASQTTVPMDVSGSDATVLTNPSPDQNLDSNRLDNQGENQASLQQTGQTSIAVPLKQNQIPPLQPRRSSGNEDQRLRQIESTAPHSNPQVPPSPSGTSALNHINTPHAPPPVAPSRVGAHTSFLHASAPRISQSSTQVALSSDMLRKPSLYSIPPWPSPSNLPVPSVQSAFTQSHIRASVSINGAAIGITSDIVQSGANHPTPAHQSSTLRPQRVNSGTQLQSFGNPPARSATPASSPSHEQTHPRVSSFQIPNARLSRKHSPNLIVDVAETCQELFPFAEVAERHEVPIQKVFDAFSAIIQLPLLRNADDRRRHGSLGKRRMKEYRDAKRAMEKAQETERKAQMREMRARVEDAAKKGQEQGKTLGLLKSAVLNNAREVHRVE